MKDSQLRKGALELIVLALLDSQPSYGGQLRQRLYDEVGQDISEGTLYPLLARLKKANRLDTHWEESPSGPPRKVYALNDAGLHHLRTLTHDWQQLNKAVDTALKGH
ncbi:MAG: PadR family transcriptional regulator [Corynebacterium camporealensis]|uniref:PadR family transcriptional regulator n=1 Tax=Corynebacterium camporealensis TaxID=161896 RepID=UPI002A917E78|nr:PadR family transcriptional regulator [Corynebacterium camporealensis]MDY5839287.1 PadR family transcriptional regulator [Corynebacterium camporealensis]